MVLYFKLQSTRHIFNWKFSMHYQVIPVTAFSQNCCVFWCDKTRRAAVIDPGGDVSKITDFLTEQKLTLEKIVLTHGHLDHVGGVAQLLSIFKVPVEGPHIADKFWIDALSEQCRMFGFDQVEGFTPDRWLNDGDEVSFGEHVLEVLHTPGHTPGHVVLHHRGSGLVQVGDVLFNGSIGRTDFPQGDHQTLLDSIHNTLLPLGDEVEFIPGHGPMSTLGYERQHNTYLR
jgi:glyoxylase-like metal-dependent hydrolase (beta-lactamase superfamily II)